MSNTVTLSDLTVIIDRNVGPNYKTLTGLIQSIAKTMLTRLRTDLDIATTNTLEYDTLWLKK